MMMTSREELEQRKEQLKEELKTIVETMLLHKDGLRRCERRMDELENSIDTVNTMLQKNVLPFSKWHRTTFGTRSRISYVVRDEEGVR